MKANETLVFDYVVDAARAGKRCPQRSEFPPGANSSCLISRLARDGWLRVEISGHNWRTIEIVQGPYRGLRTQENPSRAKPWKIIPSIEADLAREQRATPRPATLPSDFKKSA